MFWNQVQRYNFPASTETGHYSYAGQQHDNAEKTFARLQTLAVLFRQE